MEPRAPLTAARLTENNNTLLQKIPTAMRILTTVFDIIRMMY